MRTMENPLLLHKEDSERIGCKYVLSSPTRYKFKNQL